MSNVQVRQLQELITTHARKDWCVKSVNAVVLIKMSSCLLFLVNLG